MPSSQIRIWRVVDYKKHRQYLQDQMSKHSVDYWIQQHNKWGITIIESMYKTLASMERELHGLS